ncbi:MAG: hypothetical protein KC964_27200 [Candidatus Omnitrophica bacterium]|nr:hypothetical protein [Candidatus Omnitrophota bacterium]
MISLVTVVEQSFCSSMDRVQQFVDFVQGDRSGNGIEMIFVLNQCSDEVIKEILGITKSAPNIFVISLSHHIPWSTAYYTGLLSARGDILIAHHFLIDNVFKILPEIAEKIEAGCDVVLSKSQERNTNYRPPGFPRIRNIAFSFFKNLTGIDLSLTGCVIKAFRGDLLRLALAKSEFFQFTPFLHLGYGATIDSTSTNGILEAGSGIESATMGTSFKKLVDFSLFWFIHSVMEKPMRFFGTLFFLIFSLSLLTLIMTVYIQLGSKERISANALFFFFIVTSVFSSQILASGLLAELLRHFYYQVEGIKPYVVRSTRNIETASGDTYEAKFIGSTYREEEDDVSSPCNP